MKLSIQILITFFMFCTITHAGNSCLEKMDDIHDSLKDIQSNEKKILSMISEKKKLDELILKYKSKRRKVKTESVKRRLTRLILMKNKNLKDLKSKISRLRADNKKLFEDSIKDSDTFYY